MSTWKDITKDNWLFSENLIAGYGGGIGRYGTSYAINVENGQFLNGIISAQIKLPSSGVSGGGLICRASEDWSFITFNVAPDSEQSQTTVLRMSYFKQGIFHPIVALKEKIRLDSDFNLFSLEFVSNRIRGELKTSEGEYVLQHSITEMPFPGYVGLVKYYGIGITAKDININRIRIPPENKEQEESMSDIEYDVFISHASEDKPTILEIIDSFKQNGITYWVDHEQIKFGDRVTEKIEEGLQKSKYIIVCLSSSLGRSNWCKAEYGPILNRSINRVGTKKAIPIRLDDCTDDEIPLLLYDVNRVDYADKIRFSELLRFLKK